MRKGKRAKRGREREGNGGDWAIAKHAAHGKPEARAKRERRAQRVQRTRPKASSGRGHRHGAGQIVLACRARTRLLVAARVRRSAPAGRRTRLPRGSHTSVERQRASCLAGRDAGRACGCGCMSAETEGGLDLERADEAGRDASSGEMAGGAGGTLLQSRSASALVDRGQRSAQQECSSSRAITARRGKLGGERGEGRFQLCL